MTPRPSRSRAASLIVTVAVGLSLFASSAMATEFQPAAQAIWVKRSQALAMIAGDGSTQLEGSVILDNMRTSCDGLQGEQMSNEYGRVPKWALLSQVYACSAFGRWSNTGFVKTKVPCLDVQRGIDALAQMNAAEEAPDVVTAASNLKGTLEVLLQSAKGSGTLRCRF